MNFIVPKNYKFHSKLLGLIDYQTAVLNCIWGGILYVLVNLIFTSLKLKIYCFFGLFLPFFLFCIVGLNNENILDVARYIFKFYTGQKIYLYK